MIDWTDFVNALTRCPDGHYWQPDDGDAQTIVENIADDDRGPIFVRRTFTACPRCGFESPIEVEDVP